MCVPDIYIFSFPSFGINLHLPLKKIVSINGEQTKNY